MTEAKIFLVKTAFPYEIGKELAKVELTKEEIQLLKSCIKTLRDTRFYPFSNDIPIQQNKLLKKLEELTCPKQ